MKRPKTITPNDHLFALLFEPDLGDDESDPRTWAKVQPHLGITVQPDYYEKEWQRAQLSPENMLTFRTNLLNIFCINEDQVWIPASQIKAASCKWDPLHPTPDMLGATAYAAVDLSERNDFTAVTVGVHLEELHQIWTHTKYFLPRSSLKDHPNRHLYEHWVKAGYIELTDGEVIDYDHVARYVIDVADSGLNLQKIGYDDWKATEFCNVNAAYQGSTNGLQPVGQTPGDFTAPSTYFEHAIFTGNLFVNDEPVTQWCFSNATLEQDKMLNVKPQKLMGDPRRKIDGVITNVMVCALFINKGHKARNNDFEQ